ncbi:MAG: phage protease [Verrucomicrobiota bacterium]
MKKNRSIALIANAAPISGDEWVMIAPYGDHPTACRKKVQRFGREQADAMVARFNSVWHQLGTLFRGVPIFHGHPDVDRKNWPDDRRLGKITKIEAREDGLWGTPEFNALGEENRDEGWWLYPSPAWMHPRTSANVVLPDELLSVGLVNTPNIDGSQPWSNSEDSSTETETNDYMKKEELCAHLGLDPEKATDEEISSAFSKMKANAAAKTTAEANAATAKTEKATAETKVTEANTAKENAENAERETRKTLATALVNSAVTAGKVTEAEREETINSFLADDADLDKLAKDLGEKEGTLNSEHLDLGDRKVKISNARERQNAIQAEVNSRMNNQGLNYDDAFQSVKSDPKFAQLFESMKQPGEVAE